MIPVEAVEVAAKVIHDTLCPRIERVGHSGSTCYDYRTEAGAALEAAAPYMQAAEPGSAMQEAMRLAWEQGWANARGNYIALYNGQEIPEWVTLRNPYG